MHRQHTMRHHSHTLGFLMPLLGAGAMALAQNGGPVQVGDIAYGLSVGDSVDAVHLVRNCTKVGTWTPFTFLQSMEFDNLNGVSHSACGNLLALDFGINGVGGQLISLATNGTDTGNIILAFDGNNGTDLTRIGGLSVSPDNLHVAAIGYDTGSLSILNYVAGDGSGNGSASGAAVYTGVAAQFSTQGTAWLDNTHVIAYVLDSGAGDTKVKIIDISNGSVTNQVSIPVRATASTFTDVEYNPTLSPYIYCMHSSFDGGSLNTLTVLDANLSQVKQVTLEGSMQTGREIALGLDNKLYLSSYGGSAAPGPWIETISADPNQMTNNGTQDCYQAEFITSAFNGIDIAVGDCSGGGYTCTITGSCPGRINVAWAGAPSGVQQGIVFAKNTGSFTVPNGPCQGTVLGLGTNQIQLVNTIGTGSGSGSINSNVNAGACSGYVQLVAIGSPCTTSTVAQIP